MGGGCPPPLPFALHVPLTVNTYVSTHHKNPGRETRRRGHDADVAMINLDAIATRMLADALRIIGKSELMTNGRVSAASPTVTLRTLIVFAFFV